MRCKPGQDFLPYDRPIAVSKIGSTSDIGEGDCCFVCGATPSSTVFNDEHVLPDWILRRYNLHSLRITLPNRQQLTYGGYKVPCCQACNALMSDEFEVPMSAIVAQGYRALVDHLRQDGPLKLFQWLNLIFLKTHLKDKLLRFHLDRRQGQENIAELYSWEELHHIHCISRAFCSGAKIDFSSLGSLFVFPAKTGTVAGDFDYRDCYPAKTLLLRMGEIGIVTVLNDACAAHNILQNIFRKITGPLSPLQARELMARAASINLRLEEGPVFASDFDENYCRQILLARTPRKVILKDESELNALGRILYWCFEDILPMMPDEERPMVADHLRAGQYSLLLDREGVFIKNPPL